MGLGGNQQTEHGPRRGDERAFDAVLVRLLSAVAHEGSCTACYQSVGIGLDFTPFRSGLADHDGIGREQHIERHRLAFRHQLQIALQAVDLTINIAGRVLLTRRLGPRPADRIFHALEQDSPCVGKIDILVIKVGVAVA